MGFLWQKQTKQFINSLILTTMKKSILLILMLAVFAGLNYVSAQPYATGGSAPQPINCTTGPLNPVAGVPYDYTANLAPEGGIAYWFATQDVNFISGGTLTANQELIGGTFVAAASNYRDNTPGVTTPTTTTITWDAVGLATLPTNPADPPELFVAIYYSGTACADNLKVYPIKPINAFTVDILNWEEGNLGAGQYGIAEAQCFDDVQEAEYDPIANEMDYDFGTNVLYFEVIAANFSEWYSPSFQMTGLQNNQQALVEWGYVNGAYPNSLGTITGNGGTQTIGTIAQVEVDPSVPSTENGVSIYVRVTISNNDFEGLAMTPITLAVDAVNSAGQDDVDDQCNVNAVFADLAVQNLNPRPAVTSPTNEFIPQVTP